jgi:hypothetical protein
VIRGATHHRRKAENPHTVLEPDELIFVHHGVERKDAISGSKVERKQARSRRYMDYKIVALQALQMPDILSIRS